MPKIWICSDWHFGHDKDFLYEPRGFQSIKEHDREIIKRHNELVSPEDIVYHLGDEFMNDIENGIECINKLNGEIHLIRGNHSTDNKLAEIRQRCPGVVDNGLWAEPLKYGKYKFMLTHWPMLCGNYNEKSLKKATINLCGHYHTKDPFIDWPHGHIFHCEMETNDYRPWLLDDIIEQMKKKIEEEK